MGKRNSLILFIVIFFSFNVALAAQEVVYKDARPMGKIFATEEKAEVEDEQSTTESKALAYTYDPTGKTDPFKSFIAEQEEREIPKKRKPRTYLETLDLSQLDVTAIIMGAKTSWAMVREAKGLGHVIKKGTYVGTNGGVVHEIKEKEIIVREEYKDFRGQTKNRFITKKMLFIQ
ncbi:pilus assembly protein PilP [Thermodesulfobacteriota bacterium]